MFIFMSMPWFLKFRLLFSPIVQLKYQRFFGSFKSRVLNLKRKIGLKIPFKKSWTRHRRSFLVSEWVIREDKLLRKTRNRESWIEFFLVWTKRRTFLFYLFIFISLSIWPFYCVPSISASFQINTQLFQLCL